MIKVAIRGEDLPLMAFRDRAQQEIYWRSGDASLPTVIAHSRSLFKVGGH